ncbi:N-formylglutamate amidohydrolase [Sphingomonas solaris]|uniref:N-formylglutamate amidohydrolase n=1 Tax=Alterirhizorhabdus solaris TaxID=2529389 RepID=A0A558R7C2_9SPHN|nr:N-formylglutamate amidohydrolase [Sphingomonas solaris]TVV75290.1 N-formylglutamate amidohydrolase [Sphingomonas solaris]
MKATHDSPAPFDRLGPTDPLTPLVVSVPHAGRDYPASLVERSTLPVETLAALEDRHADALAAGLPAMGITTFVQRRARAWIDLNRDEREIDAAMIAPAPRPGTLIVSAKVRGGLGLIPRRIAGAGEIMRQRLTEAEVAARIASDHRPWHGAIADALAAARARFGIAVLLDLHSMPPLAPVGGRAAPRLVFGDAHGRACAPRFVARLQEVAAARGIATARNAPYAGGHTLDRHGRPPGAIHAVQMEIDRSLYLRPDLRTPGAGLAETVALVEGMVKALLAELAAVPETTLAAE